MTQNSWLIDKYIAHRGFHDNQNPENSLGAFKNAIENNYAIELDVHEISDGTLVVFHDELLSRVTGKDGYVKNLKKDELSNYKLMGTDFSIPTFKDVLDFVNGKVPLLIEIKNNGKVGSLEKKLLEMLKDYKGEYAVQSFNPYSIEWFKINAPTIKRGLLSSYFKGENLSFIKKIILKKLFLFKKAKPDFISYDCRYLPNRFVNRHKDTMVLAWTVKSQSQYLEVVKYCDNIIFENFTPKI